jgi:DNA polymerase-4/DNA polymerase V
MKFQVRKWPRALLHLDGDYFFVNVLQALHPELKGKPVVSGGERGVATSLSPEAKKLGITRTTPIFQIKKQFPQVIIKQTDYESINLFSRKMFSIVRKYSPTVEEYGIEEGFVDLEGLRRPLGMTYEQIGRSIKREVEESLGITISVGISLTKSLAKLTSNSVKPNGFGMTDGLSIPALLTRTPVEAVWGIGPSTSAYMHKIGLHTALDFASRNEEFVRKHFAKPQFEIWKELRGEQVYLINPDQKASYKSIMKSHTFSEPTNDPDLLWARLLTHVEETFKKARKYGYNVGKIFIFLKTQEFKYHGIEIKLKEKTSLPFLIHDDIKQAFDKVYKKGVMYRAAGATISDLEDTGTQQVGLFADLKKEEKIKNLYPLYDQKKIDFAATLVDKKRRVEKTKPLKFNLPMFVGRTEEQRL